MLGNVFDIKHFAVFDGPGIRTTLFLKGCPLRCRWCHNPEGLVGQAQLGFNANNCVSCGKCAGTCENGAHVLDTGHKHLFLRGNCIACGKCVSACRNNALMLYGQRLDSAQAVAELLKDRDFYECSNGGVTVSGGECLMQADFCREVLKEMKAEGIHTAVDTCGFVNRENIDKVLPFTDMFLYDIKAFDCDVHIRCTGRPNGLILDNLRYIDSVGKPFEIRIPYIPGFNSDQIDKIGAFLKELRNITKVRVLPYHNFAGTKYSILGIENKLPEKLPTDEEVEAAKRIIRSYGLKIAE